MTAWLDGFDPAVIILLAVVALPSACAALFVLGLIIWLLRDFDPQDDGDDDGVPDPDPGEPAPAPEQLASLELPKAA